MFFRVPCVCFYSNDFSIVFVCISGVSAGDQGERKKKRKKMGSSHIHIRI